MRTLTYTDGTTLFEGYLGDASQVRRKRACILIAPAWDGMNDHFRAMAKEYTTTETLGFAIDVYGRGVGGKIDGDNSHLMNPLLADRKRLLAAFAAAQDHPDVDPRRIAILGYCFGGLCALGLARANPEGLRGAATVHTGLHLRTFRGRYRAVS